VLRARAFALTLFVTTFAAQIGEAVQPDAVSQARELGEKAADAIDEHRYADALDLATRAEALYHAPTHVLMTGQAQEGLGRLTLAVETYERLLAEPLPPGSPSPFLQAQETGKRQLRALLARVPSMLVNVQGGPPVESDQMHVTVDGSPLALHAGAAVRLDPGVHALKVLAAGYLPVERSVTLPEKGGVTVVEVALQQEPGSEAVSPRPAAAPAEAKIESPERGGSPAPAIVAFGVGGAGIAVGAVAGIISLGKVSELSDRCPSNVCAPSEQSTIDSARGLATASTVGFVVGAVAVGVGTTLLILRHGPRAGASGASRPPAVAPWIGWGGAGITGRF